ncbi:MAG: hypothetical protein A2452_11320 [Candidatus Firestonebacteria bacterium RIFOXYC2_FULL_39_67]|nr:MAG: hypothetical protein A2536_10040 [Candidatus Firestonebacteria bacterium RIFOXYD2_FULL_39_29]OGF54536.1 MAG: hypothetical protein A2452_11320 [Candidatus Firestonebacteria bacterium RIFOXYC2_FULL_39_67]OGF57937.1 MAG: hypothetical protein A2497_04775 [Candidatus Firestonebacteria bacterium RifOxyC12_full_39_7]
MGLIKRIKEKVKESKFFFVSFTAHLLILFLVSGIVIVNPTMRKTVFRGILQMGGGGKAETPEWETQKQLPSSKSVDIPSMTKQEIKVTDAKVVINTTMADKNQSSAVIKPLDIVGAGGGEGGGMGTGIGKGIGAGIGIFSARMNRTEMAKKYGGSPMTETSVNKGLEYLFAKQNADGSWEVKPKVFEGWQVREPEIAISSFATLAFLGAGYRVDSPHKYAKTLQKAIKYLVSKQTPNGYISGDTTYKPETMYVHCIASIALSEAFAVGGASNIKANLEKAIKIIISAQEVEKTEANKGGWRYGPGSGDSDLSVSGWAIMALKDAFYSNILKLEIKNALEASAKYVIKTDGRYMTQGAFASATDATRPIAIFCLFITGKSDDPLIKKLTDSLCMDISKVDYYQMYYNNLALFQIGGKKWEDWNKTFREFIVTKQNQDGSFQPLKQGLENKIGFNYTTAMAVLCLEIYYRYLPIYQIVNK